MGCVPETPTGVHLKTIPILLQIAPIQHGDYANADVREWNMDIIEGTRKNVQIGTKKNATFYSS